MKNGEHAALATQAYKMKSSGQSIEASLYSDRYTPKDVILTNPDPDM